ncbi:MAG: MbtH family NRPS accessory protein [Burkholderiales bacterium]|nr:MbtH family NRPS accessory protein [Burkholderiales bacterium]
MSGTDIPAATHQLIVNDQEQFAVWPATRRVPNGWRPVGRTGTRESLTEYLREILVETLPAPLMRSDGRPGPSWD